MELTAEQIVIEWAAKVWLWSGICSQMQLLAIIF